LLILVEFSEMGCQQSTTKSEKFTWKIENFSRLNAEKICSEPFILGGYPWYVIQMNDFTFPTGRYCSLFICSLIPFITYFCVLCSLGRFVCIQRGTRKQTTYPYQFIWRLWKLLICLRDGADMQNLSCLFSISSRHTKQSPKVFFTSSIFLVI
jgi:hypothetical protein